MPKLKRCMQVKRCPKCKFRDELDNCYILRSTYFEYECPFYKKLKDGETFNPDKKYIESEFKYDDESK